MGIGLRVFNIWQRGLLEYDEGYFLCVVRTYWDVLEWIRAKLIGHPSPVLSLFELKDFLLSRGDAIYHAGKPGHIALLFLSSIIGGLNDVSPLILNVFLGSGTILIVFILGELLFNWRIGLLASGFVALDPLSINFSRSALAQTNSVFFLYLAFWLYCRSFTVERKRVLNLILSGGFAGIAFVIHYNIAWIIFVILINEFFLTRFRDEQDLHNHLSPVLRFSLLLTSFLSALVLVNLPFAIMKLRLKAYDPNFQSYFDELFYNFLTFQQPAFTQSSLFLQELYRTTFYFPGLIIRYFSITGFIIIVLAFIFATVRLLREKRPNFTLIFTLFFLPLLIWTVYPLKFERTFVPLMPALALLIAIGFTEINETRFIPARIPRFLSIILFFLMILMALSTDIKIIREQFSNYRQGARQLAEYLEKYGGTVNARSFNRHSFPLWAFYLQEFIDEQKWSTADAGLNLADKSTPTLVVYDARTSLDTDFLKRHPATRLKVLFTVPATPSFSEITIYQTAE
ncbi:MAG: glycosyltransferase family 39 protein [Candidatus Sumerlaeia bacterium]|nr:glycosyltransferase family 39 protein [Candidatus Sumerlaeia bacterium]